MPKSKALDPAALRARAQAIKKRSDSRLKCPDPGLITLQLFNILLDIAEEYGMTPNEAVRQCVEAGAHKFRDFASRPTPYMNARPPAPPPPRPEWHPSTPAPPPQLPAEVSKEIEEALAKIPLSALTPNTAPLGTNLGANYETEDTDESDV